MAALEHLASAAVLAAVVACLATEPAGAVVEGIEVQPSSVPWFASLGGCGGTLVAPDRVLTAAHCVSGMYARDAAATSPSAPSGARRRTSRCIPTGAGATARNFLDDVAIVELDAPVAGVPLVTLGGAHAGARR